MRACWALAVAGLSASGPGREGGWAAEKPAGPARWAHAGERKGPTGPREKDGLDWAWDLGVLGWIKGLSPLSFSILFQHTQTKLNSNSNLNSTLALNQIKEMLQHDATTKIKPMMNFNYLRNKIRLNSSLTQ